MKQTLYKYFVYIIYFLGIGMTSSGIVLMPFNTFRYTIILCTGLFLFTAGSIFNEVVIDRHNLSTFETLRFLFLSLTLAIGIGMISGGISHFKESPVYVSFLIPLGIIISFLSFTQKNQFALSKKEKILLHIGVVIFSTILFIILYSVASHLMNTGMEAGGDIFNKMH